jgi:tetraacyldisaccharide 4'-kinase
VLTRCDQVGDVSALREEIRVLTDDCPVFQSQMRAVRVSPLKNGAESIAAPARVAAFCAVGNPSSFFAGLRGMGYEVVLQKSFADHHTYSQEEIDSLNQAAKEMGAEALVTTAKDAVKLRPMVFSIPCYVLEIAIEIEEEDEFKRLVIARLEPS